MHDLLRVLYVDDDTNDLAIFGLAAERAEGVEIWLQTVTDGQQAIDYLEGTGQYADRTLYQLPELLVVDGKMPGTDGADFLAWRQSSPSFSKLPVVFLTGSAHPTDRERALGLGASVVLTKPLSMAEWERMVKEIYQLGISSRSGEGTC